MRAVRDRTEIQRYGSKVVFSVRGCHTLAAAETATDYLSTTVAEVEGSLEFIADLSDLTAFDREARDVWQSVFAQVKSRISCITLVKGSPLARMTASAVGLHGGIRIRACESVEEALKLRGE